MADKPPLENSAYSLPHIRIDQFGQRADYKPPSRGFSSKESGIERFSHGGKLTAELAQALAAAHRMLEQRDPDAAAGKPGVYVEIASQAKKVLPEMPG